MMSSQSLRVLQLGKFYPPYHGGMEIALEQLCAQLRDRVDLQVLVSGTCSETQYDVCDGIPVRRMGRRMEIASTSFCPGLTRAIAETPADIIHLHHPNPAATLALLASHHPAPVVVTYHSDVIRQKLLGMGFELILRRLFDRTSAIIATSPHYIESSSVLQAYRDRCHVIPLGTDVGYFDAVDRAEVERIRNQYGPHMVLSVGRLVYYKGFQYLIEAMRKVQGQAVIIGTGALRDELSAQARAAGVEDRVHLLGEIEDLRPYYHACQMFVLPSVARSEAFGIVQIEAMACGKPVVNTRLDTGVPFVSRDNVTGFTVSPNDPEVLAGAINYLLNHAELRSRFGAAARQRVESRFSLPAMAEATMHVYRRVATASEVLEDVTL